MHFWAKAIEVLEGRRPIVSLVTPGVRTVRIAVIGSKGSGKTVFLTALANHLQAHNPKIFPLDGLRVRWDRGAVSGNTLDGLKLFDYGDAKSCLTRGEWPRKTTEATLLALRLMLKDADDAQEEIQLEILDVPGERVADFPMMGRNYEEWCGWMEDNLAGPNGTSMAYRDYLRKVESAGAGDEQALLRAYRDFLAHEYAHFKGITPSTVKLGLDGSQHGGSAENFRAEIEDAAIGFTERDGEACEFIPLPKTCFAGGSSFRALAGKYAKAYAGYSRRVVEPMANWLGGAQKLFYLVDVLSLLQSGPEAWDTEKEYADAALTTLCPGRLGFARRVWRWATGVLWRTHINSVCVVATKSDLVFSTANRDNMVALAEEFLGATLDFIDPGVKTSILSCAAVCSTSEVLVGGERCLKGMLPSGDGAGMTLALQNWIPSDVPAAKPSSSAEWNAMIAQGRFNYQFAFPGFDASQSCPPPHLGLNTIVREMLAN